MLKNRISLLLGLLFVSASIFVNAQTVSTVAGGGLQGYAGDSGIATNASVKLNHPNYMAKDAAGNLYFTEGANNTVRKVSTSGIITTIAGRGPAYPGSLGDGGPAVNAMLDRPYGIAIDAAGNIYIGEWNSNRIRKINSAGIISTICGGGIGYSGDGGPATIAGISWPLGIAVDDSGNVFIADFGNNCVRKINSAGIISTIAGMGPYTYGFSGNGGLGINAKLDGPTSVAVDATGNVFVVDGNNNMVRKINPAGIIVSVVGDTTMPGYCGYGGDGGPAILSYLNNPFGITLDAAGNIYIGDGGNDVIRKVNASGIISTIVGVNGSSLFNGDGHTGPTTHIGSVLGMLVSDSTLYFGDLTNVRIRKIGLSTTGVAEVAFHDDIRLFPNPNTGVFSLSGHINNDNSIVQLSVETITGAVVFTEDIPVYNGRFQKHITIDGELPAGNYIARLTCGPAQKTVVFFKQ